MKPKFSASATDKLVKPEAWTDRHCNVVVIGCGGTGSELLDALVRLHYTMMECGHRHGLRITLIDGDEVSPANVGRQRFLHTDVGQNKAKVMAARYTAMFGESILYVNSYAGPKIIKQLGQVDVVVSCVDKADFRVKMGAYWARKITDALWLDTGNGKSSAQVILGHLGRNRHREKRLPNIYDLYPSLAAVDDTSEPSCSLPQALRRQQLGINQLTAAQAVFGLLAPLMLEGAVQHHGFFIDMAKLSTRPLRIDAAAWNAIHAASIAQMPKMAA